MNWLPITPSEAHTIPAVLEDDVGPTGVLAQRVYGWNGAAYPILTVAFRRHGGWVNPGTGEPECDTGGGIVLAVDVKTSSVSWWRCTELPPQLAHVLPALAREAEVALVRDTELRALANARRAAHYDDSDDLS